MPTGSNFILGQLNTAADPTDLQPTTGTIGVRVLQTGNAGIVGAPNMNAGVLGLGPIGVSGISLNQDSGVGVAGLGVKVGVAGDSFGNRSVGTRGNADFLGVLGTASTAIRSGPVVGVQGETQNPNGLGVNGQSGSFIGVRGLAGPGKTVSSPIGAGVVGAGVMGCFVVLCVV